MESIAMLLHDAIINEYPYHATEVEDRVYRQVDHWAEHGGPKKKRFHDDMMKLLAQYQERGFALGLKYGLMLAGELFDSDTL